jgi:UDP-2,3-diacylglucosamine hydrolase
MDSKEKSALNVSEPDGFLYIVADSHLDESIALAKEFVEMLSQLENPHTVVFLGDLFKIWLAPQKFWTDLHRETMKGFEQLRDSGSNVVFIAGNREMLLPRKLTDHWKKIIPFTHLSHSDWFLNWGGKRYAFIHGDTINYNDSQYLRWKALTHNIIFEAFFRAIPGALARWIAGRIETMLVNTNQEYKVHYPAKEIQEFAEAVLPEVDQYFVGHFHRDHEIKVEGASGVLRIVPDWLSQRKVLKLNPKGELEVLRFENGTLKTDH